MEKQKLTVEELQEFQVDKQESNRLAAMLGEIHYQKVILDLELEKVKKSIEDISNKQRKQLEQLGVKYGNGVIDPQTGEITHLPGN